MYGRPGTSARARSSSAVVSRATSVASVPYRDARCASSPVARPVWVEVLASEQHHVLRRAATPYLEHARHLVDRVGRHAPIGRELAARDRHDSTRGAVHRMTAREVGGLRADGVLHEWSQPGPGPEDVRLGDTGRHRRVERTQDVLDVLWCALRIVERAVVIRVGGTDVGEVSPRNDEERAPILRHGDDDRDVVLGLGPRNRDVDTLGRADRLRASSLVERAQLVGPHSCRVHDDSGAHRDLDAVSGDRGTHHLAVGVLREGTDGGVVRDCGPVGCRGPGDRERETGVVGLRVVVQVGGGKALGRHRGHVRQRGFLGQSLVQLADAQPPGEVVHPHRRAEGPPRPSG